MKEIDLGGIIDSYYASEVDLKGQVRYSQKLKGLGCYDPINNGTVLGKEAALLTDEGVEAVLRHEASHFKFLGLPFATQLAITAGFKAVTPRPLFQSILERLYGMNEEKYFDWCEKKAMLH